MYVYGLLNVTEQIYNDFYKQKRSSIYAYLQHTLK